eukprot:jgi/Botrbrau1/2268/Bobra.101_2s0091.1
MPLQDDCSSPGVDTGTESNVAYPPGSEMWDLHKKLAAAKTKSARDSKRHQRARKKADELQQKLETVMQEKEALLAENQRLHEGSLAIQESGGGLGASLRGAGTGSLGSQLSKLNGMLWGHPAPLGPVKEFVPAKGYDMLEEDAILVLSAGQSVPTRLSKQNVQSMTTWHVEHILETYGKAFQRAINVGSTDWTGGTGHSMLSVIRGLVNEATAFGCFIALNNSTLRASHTAQAKGLGKGVDYQQLMGLLRLTPEQQQRMVEMRATYLCTVALLANERNSIMANCKDLEYSFEDALGLAMEQLSLKQGMDQLTHNLQRQDTYLCTFTDGVLREVLSPIQAAHVFMNTCPYYPDVLAMANVVAVRTGQQSPDEFFQEAAAIRLAPSVAAALRRQAEQTSNPKAQGSVSPGRGPRHAAREDAPAWHMPELVPLSSAQREDHPGPPGPPAPAGSASNPRNFSPTSRASLGGGPMSDLHNLGYPHMRAGPVQAGTAPPMHMHGTPGSSSVRGDEMAFRGDAAGGAGLSVPDLLGSQKPSLASELSRMARESAVSSFANGKMGGIPHPDSPWHMHGASPQMSTSRGSGQQDSASSAGNHAQLPHSTPPGTSPYTTPPPDPPANHNSAPPASAGPGPLTSTLSQLLDMASQQYQAQNDRMDFSRFPSLLPSNSEFPSTWSIIDRPFGASLPSSMSLGLPLHWGSRGGDGQLASPAVSLVLPDVATILSGLEGGDPLQHESRSHPGLDLQRAGFGGVQI